MSIIYLYLDTHRQWFNGLVVMISVSHTGGPRFDPGLNHYFQTLSAETVHVLSESVRLRGMWKKLYCNMSISYVNLNYCLFLMIFRSKLISHGHLECCRPSPSD